MLSQSCPPPPMIISSALLNHCHFLIYASFQLDEFSLNLGSQELGEVKKLEIGFATQQSAGGGFGGLFGKNWHLMSVEVVHLNTGMDGMNKCDGAYV